MARTSGTTTQRGYGYHFQQDRLRYLAAWWPGQPCARCGQPIWATHDYILGRRVSVVDLGHTADRTAYTGLEHRACNRADGARRKNAQSRTVTHMRIW